MRKSILSIAALFGILVAQALVPLHARADDCVADPNDPFSKPEPMPVGSHYGPSECINTALYRPVTRLTPEERAEFQIPNDDSLEAIANFNHQNAFWVAVIPMERIHDVVAIQIPLAGKLPVFHTALRFRLTPGGRPVQLIEQIKDAASRKTMTLDEDIVFSEFAARGIDHQETFSIEHGITGYYASAAMVASLSQETAADIAANDLIRQYELNVSVDQGITALQTGITLGTEYGMERIYNTFTESCTTASFFALDTAIGHSQADWLREVLDSIDPAGGFRYRHLIGPGTSSRIENL